MREVSLEAFQVDENVAMWTIICRSTVLVSIASNCLTIGWEGRGPRTGPLGSNLRVGADRIGYQESENMPGFVRAQRARA